jgi:hypothetical protein
MKKKIAKKRKNTNLNISLFYQENKHGGKIEIKNIKDIFGL